jgi:hypothetical protein
MIHGRERRTSFSKWTERHGNTSTPTLCPCKHPLICPSPFPPIHITSRTSASLPQPCGTLPSRTTPFTLLHILSTLLHILSSLVSHHRTILRTLTRFRKHTQSHHTSNHTEIHHTSNCKVTHSFLNLPRSVPHTCTHLQPHTHRSHTCRTQHTPKPLNDLTFTTSYDAHITDNLHCLLDEYSRADCIVLHIRGPPRKQCE